MKIKVLSVICAAMLTFSLAGCGKDAWEQSASDTGSSTTEVADNATDSTSVSGTFVKMNIHTTCTPFDIIVLVSFD
ncbi:MAG: hypothetical protein II586_10365 [Butyrivibrio sp.]|nr:hypothetical protein [Butyrivibrio sp.]MBQ4218582.1 hypothetical protein [Butyrivibrio sp.]